jgi:two-component system phosphate regulon sensor histidine kinase PhoR
VKVATRLVVGAAAILVLATLVLTRSTRSALEHDLERHLAAEFEREARLVQDALPANPAAWPRMVARWAQRPLHRVTVFDGEGRVVADSRLPPNQLQAPGSLAEVPEVRAALAGRVGVDRRAEGVEPPLLYVAVPGVPIVRVAGALDEVQAILGPSRRRMRWASMLAVVVGTMLAWFAGRSIARPLAEIAGTARALPAGAPPRFPRSRMPEINQLSQALREMHRQLAERATALHGERAGADVLVDAMVEGVLAADGRGRIVIANPAARRMLGYGPSDPLPDLPALFRAPAARDAVDAALAGRMGEERELELDGLIVTLSARPLPTGGAVVVLHDLTQLRRLETVRRDFIANVSHELKTPLTSLSGYAETLMAVEETDPDTRRRFLHTILSNARRMQQLVDDQLDLSRIESGTWQPQPSEVDLARVAGEVWAARADRAMAAGVRFALDPGPGAATLLADAEALRQVLENLMDNALRYTPAGGVIACRSRREGDGVMVEVSDTGTGIGQEHLPRIFERYYRVDPARSRQEGGTGLGLAIVKHLVEAHGGRVAAESELGRGTTIRCWFPRSSVTRS